MKALKILALSLAAVSLCGCDKDLEEINHYNKLVSATLEDDPEGYKRFGNHMDFTFMIDWNANTGGRTHESYLGQGVLQLIADESVKRMAFYYVEIDKDKPWDIYNHYFLGFSALA